MKLHSLCRDICARGLSDYGHAMTSLRAAWRFWNEHAFPALRIAASFDLSAHGPVITGVEADRAIRGVNRAVTYQANPALMARTLKNDGLAS